MNTVNSTASKATLKEFAQENFGVVLPDEMTQKDMYAEVKVLMEKAGVKSTLKPKGNESDDDIDADGGNEENTGDKGDQESTEEKAAAAATKEPVAYTIEIQKPHDTKFDEYVCCVNTRNFQVRFNELVRVKPEVVESLRLAVNEIPAYKNPDGKVEPARKQARFIWAIHQKHYS
ncbi:hypothetical protein [Arsukibacterium indicum]|uniref:Uncharacterized protein n=1 Tax=Arsukibacterium indicum TaxID=2848612 RepID=A0ABS6MIV5_9GAMM|nr:hypothetical protein [Arsukibacterium indicum]MBV2128162.1 hypothetical protein [Arsukibacterium indicum]